MMSRGKHKFNEISVGTVGQFGMLTFVKIKDAETDKFIRLQLPNAVDLKDGHYVVIAADAVCEIVKTPRDPKYTHDGEVPQLVFDCDQDC